MWHSDSSTTPVKTVNEHKALQKAQDQYRFTQNSCRHEVGLLSSYKCTIKYKNINLRLMNLEDQL